MLNSFIESVLVVVIGFALKYVFAAIGVAIDDALFNTLVAAMVLWVMRALGLEVVRAGLRSAKLIK